MITGGGAGVLPWVTANVRDGGHVHYFAGGGGDALPLPLDALYKRELTLMSTYSSSPRDLTDAFALIAKDEITTAPLFSHRLPLDRLGEAVALMRGQAALKVFVTP
jgi:L-iditol 2-dehydrogenase